MDPVDPVGAMDPVIDHIAEILMRCCPTEQPHSYQVAGMIVQGLGLRAEARGGGTGATAESRQFRYVTDWLDE